MGFNYFKCNNGIFTDSGEDSIITGPIDHSVVVVQDRSRILIVENMGHVQN